ncbi:acyltransferase family protein [Halomonas sp. RA08-2]|uniref:acyltransferase family protein n=1 Tax=Halomonas sp. RA08-2 TaxID=3440842 RepID=UPI003EF06E76
MDHPKYRPDIDGLRAVAVLSVVAYHFNKDWLPGGFVGVDVFFVISGFLITGIIQKSLSSNNFLFSEFYLRRIRRIMPATIFVTLVTLIFGATFMLPEDAKDLAYSASASLLTVANIYFWLFLDTSYFASSSELVPLLHMWSLGVEEQFYLIWPGLLYLSYRFHGKKGALCTGIIIAISSFIVSEFFLSRDALFSYYMLPSRAGELMLGGISFYILDMTKKPITKRVSETISLIGISGLIGSMLFINSDMGFPGLLSFIPAFSTALIIIGGSFYKTAVSRSLSIKMMTAIGLLSFSLYLWHWPVLAFYRYAYGEPTLVGGTICALLIILFTLFSYWCIERPFRFGFKISRLPWSTPAITGSAFIIGISLFLHMNEGFIRQLSPANYAVASERFEELTKSAPQYSFVCQRPRFERDLFQDPRCLLGPTDTPANTLIVGDSNASHYVGYFKEVAEQHGIAMRNIAHSSCVPLLSNAGAYVRRNNDSCEAFNQAAMEEAKNYDNIIIGASWTSYRGDEFIDDLSETVAHLSDNASQVIIALKIPVIRDYDRMCELKSIKIPFMNCKERSTSVDNGDYSINLAIEKIAANHSNVTTFSLRDKLCTNGHCSAYMDQTPVYFDAGHLSMLGSSLIGKKSVMNGSDRIAALLARQ